MKLWYLRHDGQSGLWVVKGLQGHKREHDLIGHARREQAQQHVSAPASRLPYRNALVVEFGGDQGLDQLAEPKLESRAGNVRIVERSLGWQFTLINAHLEHVNTIDIPRHTTHDRR